MSELNKKIEVLIRYIDGQLLIQKQLIDAMGRPMSPYAEGYINALEVLLIAANAIRTGDAIPVTMPEHPTEDK